MPQVSMPILFQRKWNSFLEKQKELLTMTGQYVISEEPSMNSLKPSLDEFYEIRLVVYY